MPYFTPLDNGVPAGINSVNRALFIDQVKIATLNDDYEIATLDGDLLGVGIPRVAVDISGDESTIQTVFDNHVPTDRTDEQALQDLADTADIAAQDFDYDAFTRKAILKAIAKHERLLLYVPLANQINAILAVLKAAQPVLFAEIEPLVLASLADIKAAVDSDLGLS